MNATIITAVVRHILTAAGGGLAVSWGLDGEAWQGIVGAISTLAGLAWSILDKRSNKQQ